MQADIVAKALAELLKIFGALGIVNFFTLSMMYKSNAVLMQSTTKNGQISFSGEIQNQIRDFYHPDWAAILCGIALILVFIRLFYGSLILFEGEYISNKSKKDIHIFDFVSVIIYMPVFALMSMYAGMGNMHHFFWLLLLILGIDVAVMLSSQIWIPVFETFESSYKAERHSWVVANSAAAFILLASYALVHSNAFAFEYFAGAMIIYSAISIVEIVYNWQFYFLGRSVSLKAMGS